MQSLQAAFRLVSNATGGSVITDTLKRELLEDFARQIANPLKNRVCEELRQELRGADGGAGAVGDDSVIRVCLERAEHLFAAPAWQNAVQGIIHAAFQEVLPSLVKRLREDIDQRLSGAGGGGGGGASISEVVNSVQMKEMIDERFRSMLLYLKQEVIPKALQASGR
jgi:hypothetical protein